MQILIFRRKIDINFSDFDKQNFEIDKKCNSMAINIEKKKSLTSNC